MAAETRDKYRGLCVGGPADGKIIEAKGTWFVVVQLINQLNLRMYEQGDAMPGASNTAESVRYDYLPMLVQFKEFGFWVSGSHKEDFIMRQLITSYERKHQ